MQSRKSSVDICVHLCLSVVKFTPNSDRIGSSVIIEVQPQSGNDNFVGQSRTVDLDL
jgi:hypothetical protein